jgi:hypothetical protein
MADIMGKTTDDIFLILYELQDLEVETFTIINLPVIAGNRTSNFISCPYWFLFWSEKESLRMNIHIEDR